MSISIEDYFGPWIDHSDATPMRKESAAEMLSKVNALLQIAEAEGVQLHKNPVTGTLVSGEKYGGFRPKTCPQGAEHSTHKEGRGVDIFDSHNDLDNWLTTFDADGGARNSMLESCGLYREHPDSTYLGSDGKPHPWCHLSDRAPGSGRRTFKP